MPQIQIVRIMHYTYRRIMRLGLDKKEYILKSAQLLFTQFGLKKVTADDIAPAGPCLKSDYL